MTGFKPWPSGVGSNRFAKLATTTAQGFIYSRVELHSTLTFVYDIYFCLNCYLESPMPRLSYETLKSNKFFKKVLAYTHIQLWVT